MLTKFRDVFFFCLFIFLRYLAEMPSGAIMPPYQARLEERRGLFVNPQYGISNYAHQGNRVTQPVNAPYDSYWQIGVLSV